MISLPIRRRVSKEDSKIVQVVGRLKDCELNKKWWEDCGYIMQQQQGKRRSGILRQQTVEWPLHHPEGRRRDSMIVTKVMLLQSLSEDSSDV